jgi:DNA-binding transcriptional ArsR family regulator
MIPPSIYKNGINLNAAQSYASRIAKQPSVFSDTYREDEAPEVIEADARSLGHLIGSGKAARWSRTPVGLQWQERHRRALAARASRKRRAKIPPKGTALPPARGAILAALAGGPLNATSIGRAVGRGPDSARNHLKVMERARLVEIADEGIAGPNGKEATWKLK